MKHRQLLAVAHNYAASLASGLGFVVGYCPADVYGEAEKNEDRCIEVDFLAGTAVSGKCSSKLSKALKLYGLEFEAFCRRNHALRSDFTEFRGRYFLLPTGRRFSILVRDRFGKASSREYEAFPGRRVKVLDRLGRLRPKRSDC